MHNEKHLELEIYYHKDEKLNGFKLVIKAANHCYKDKLSTFRILVDLVGFKFVTNIGKRHPF